MGPRTCNLLLCHQFCVLLDLRLQIAFSYMWMQLIPRMLHKSPVRAVEAVQNVLLGRKR